MPNNFQASRGKAAPGSAKHMAKSIPGCTHFVPIDAAAGLEEDELAARRRANIEALEAYHEDDGPAAAA